MDQIELQKNGIEVLRAFNNAIVTSRLYPPTAPQVSNAVELGYNGLYSFLRQYGKLDISLRNGQPFLGDFPVDPKIISSFSNLIVYRQMEQLGVVRLLIDSSMDRFAFTQVLSVFAAKVDKIQEEGGGIKYITGLGLSSFFPAPVMADVSADTAKTKSKSSPKIVLKIDTELLACLLGKNDRPEVREKLEKIFRSRDEAVKILAAAIGHILQELQKVKMISRSQLFNHLLRGADTLIEKEDHHVVAFALAKVLVDNLREPALCVLIAQEYGNGFGRELYGAQVTLLSNELLRNVIILLREQLARVELTEEADSAQVGFVSEALSRLLNTTKGKQFIGSEKARELIHKGEEERIKLRIKAGIQGIIRGNFTSLRSAEFLDYLPGVVRRMADVGDVEQLDALIQQLSDQFKVVDNLSQSEFIKTFITITENCVSDGKWRYVNLLLNPLFEWTRKTESNDELFERVVGILQDSMQHYWKSGNMGRGDSILALFHQIRTGELKKSTGVQTVVADIQDRNIQRSSLPELLTKCFQEPENDDLSRRLVFQGPVALRFLVESLIKAEESDQQDKIIALLPENDRFVSAIVRERLPEHMVWYGKRNLIKLLAKTGFEEDADIVLSYLNHEDFRVQREAFLCIYKISGKDTKRIFLTALADSSELIKIQIIDALVRFCDPEIASRLAELLVEHEEFSEENREALLVQLLSTLGRCPCPVSAEAVEGFLKSRGHRSTRKFSQQVWAEAEKAMHLLEEDQQKVKKVHVQASQLRKNAIRQAAKRGKTSPAQRIITGLAEEQSIRILLNRGEEEKAREQLVELIDRTAQTRNFVQAEKLREWLVDINETALGDIIRAAEIISDKKANTIDKTHLEIWGKLYEFLTTEEFSAVYHSLQHRKYEDEELVVHQGALQTALYFINSGRVKLFFKDKGNSILVKTMGRGEIIGAGSFFDASVWTISVASVGITDISILRFEKMQQWNAELPDLGPKLRDFCLRFESVGEIIRKSSQDRRKYKRHRITGRVTTLLLDNTGQTTGASSEAKLFDISRGGISYRLRMEKKENGRLILGRKVKIMLSAEKNSEKHLGVIGDILAVKESLESENIFSVHVRFDTIINSLQLKEIVLAV